MPGVDTLVSFAPFLVPVITGLVGGISLVFRDRREARSADHHYRRRLEKAQMEVQFITGWIEAKKLAPTGAPDPEPGHWLDECYASVRSFEAAALRQRGGPGRLRRLFLLRTLDGVPANAVRALYWLALLAFNAALAWWVSMVLGGPPAFFGKDVESQSDDVDAVLGVAGFFLLVAVVLWAWTVHLDASEPAEGYRSRIDSAAWAAREEERRKATARRKADRDPAGPQGGDRPG
ncbi:hypothetical protein [Streptomyces sp. NBC_01565]|uniref:hypothetical protein n=1 Tax=unclassified Streptomyces TaxID=2593676 RepID=UPI002252FF5A|nr:hypothetical protein [Streptomyces sp. NBC_01565]MCX4539335.1 hypothetical protein [Streptomyces sp. NBC_01565]